MYIFLADENVPGSAVSAARLAGYDLDWIQEIMPGADDESVLAHSLAESRVLVTFDKDFGELAFRRGKKSTSGVILLRPRIRAPEYIDRLIVNVLGQPIVWEGFFSTVREGRIRCVPLPD